MNVPKPTSMVTHRPRFTPAEGARIARESLGVDGVANPLAGERDQNFELRTDDGTRYLLKISHPEESRSFLALHDLALQRLAEAECEGTPRCVSIAGFPSSVEVEGTAGRSVVRLLSWVDGVPLAELHPHDDGVARQIGDLLARVDSTLATIDCEGADRRLPWHPERALDSIRARLPSIADPSRREIVERWLARFDETVVPTWESLPRQLIHNDANEHNIRVAQDVDGETRVTGLIDFGDMVESPRVADPAIASAYLMLNKRDPLASSASLVGAYHRRHPLREEELDVLFEFAALRLVLSVAMSSEQTQLVPDDDYLNVSSAPAWELLPRLFQIHPRFAQATLRLACGYASLPISERWHTWMQSASFAPILPKTMTTYDLLDLSVDAPGFGAGDTATISRRLFRRLEDSGASVGVGRYDEVRTCYLGDHFGLIGEDRLERRTVHLGIDLFVPAGTPLTPPLDGEVCSLQDNRGRLDYGPTVILRHAPPDGPAFFTLYGHLDRACLERLTVGEVVEVGQPFAEVGDYPDNGDWPPHVHFQVILDRLQFVGDFPGVAAPSQREVLLAFSPDPTSMLDLPAEARASRGPTVDALWAARRAHQPKSLGVSYRRPLKIVRGEGAYLLDHEGQPYLDGVNNVCHVGHCHPHVVAAATRQIGLLNTNSRYLHDLRGQYVERLLALFPSPLDVCMLVSTGSEANELALRLARVASGRRDLIALTAAYHGITDGLIDVSHYKYAKARRDHLPEHVAIVPLPDRYRGLHRDLAGDLGARYAAHVEETVARLVSQGRPPAAFLAESIASCGGQIVYPDGYLARAYASVRNAGGVAIADEVQVGFGRVGSHWWGFETQGVVPDIVTLGKPIGNGHPMAAVITTRAIAEAFADGPEFFSTFGGNPVSCAIGNAVLDVIEREGLRERARDVGGYMLAQLRASMSRHALIGDVRGVGLFLGIELVLDRESRTPAPREASYVVNRLRDKGVFLSVDGPDENVLKLKPPLVWTMADADFFLDRFHDTCAETFLTGK